MSRKKEIIDVINAGQARLCEIQQALTNGDLTATELENKCGFDSQLIDRVTRFNNYSFFSQFFNDFPPLKKDAMDVYFIGMPSSGKTTILSSLLTHINRIGKLKIDTSNDLCLEYIDNLIELGKNGYCPGSNYDDIVLGCPISFGNYSKKNRSHSLNFIDIPGASLMKLSPGFGDFSESSNFFYKNYLSNKNRKILIFTIDYECNEKIFKANFQLQYALHFLLKGLNFGTLIDAIYFVVTKADLFPVNNENNPSFVEEHISSSYRNILNTVQELKKKNRFEIKIFPYSIGPVELRYLYKEPDPYRNSYLKLFPDILYKEICNTCNSRRNWFQRLIR